MNYSKQFLESLLKLKTSIPGCESITVICDDKQLIIEPKFLTEGKVHRVTVSFSLISCQRFPGDIFARIKEVICWKIDQANISPADFSYKTVLEKYHAIADFRATLGLVFEATNCAECDRAIRNVKYPHHCTNCESVIYGTLEGVCIRNEGDMLELSRELEKSLDVQT